MTMEEDKYFVPPGHFYSPIPDRDEVQRHFDRISQTGSPAGIDFRDDFMRDTWLSLLPAMRRMPFGDDLSEQFRYYYMNDQFSYGDAAALYAMLTIHRPKRFVEIGSGFSSALALDTRTLENLGTHFTFIEPFPGRLNNLLRPDDHSVVEVIEQKVQYVSLDVFSALEPGDVLFIDSSHVVKTGSDVCFELLEILPILNRGVIVGIHDMFYPFEYPRSWCLDENRGWTELYMVRALLTFSVRYRIRFFNHYFGLRHHDLASDPSVMFHKNFGGTLWLDVVS